MTARSPFLWREDKSPTIFANDPRFPAPPAPGKKTKSQAISQRVDAITKATGRNPGTIYGLTKPTGRSLPHHMVRPRGKRG
jgi:hypothetical protein